MRLVSYVLKHPYTVTAVLILVGLLGIGAALRMPVDIFPDIGQPTIYVAQPYGGMDPSQMEGYVTYYYEYHFLYITGIEHVESKSIQGASLMKLQFHPGTDMSQALSETIGYVNRARAFMPPGTVPPFVMRFDAGSVPVAVINETMASKFWPHGDVIGARINIDDNNAGPRPVEIIGVVGNVKHLSLESTPTFDVYLPIAQVHED